MLFHTDQRAINYNTTCYIILQSRNRTFNLKSKILKNNNNKMSQNQKNVAFCYKILNNATIICDNCFTQTLDVGFH